ncbi:MAG: ATP-dependent DNA helicase, partial [Lachnospiraceae bacterium]
MDKEQKYEEKQNIKISVRNLVEFILRSGDIDNRRGRSMQAEAMQAGSRIHRKIQRRMGASYHAEVPLKIEIPKEHYHFFIEGRADGIIKEETVTIDEIKGVYMDLTYLEEPIGVHLAQAKCYAYIYASQNELEQINVQMTYCNLDTEEMKRFVQPYETKELKEWFFEVVAEYEKWADFQYQWRCIRQESIHGLEFPYEYREGQKELASDVYRTIRREKILFIQAPTGVGKTISTIYPAIKAVGEDLAEKIFYLTAKTITATVALETFDLLKRNGYRAKTILITAKEKMCLCEEMECNPEVCPYAKGHFDRVNDAVFDLLQTEEILTREIFWEQAKKYKVCPFELCLDTASWSDNIICDYNYVFDPNVYL